MCEILCESFIIINIDFVIASCYNSFIIAEMRLVEIRREETRRDEEYLLRFYKPGIFVPGFVYFISSRVFLLKERGHHNVLS
jgi:hypothetical protein